MYYANTNQKKAGEAILISDRAVFRTRKVIRDKGEHHLVIKVQFSRKTQPSVMCMHLTTEHLKYVRQKLIALKGEINESTNTDGVLSTPLSDRQIHQAKISKDTGELNNTIHHLYK